MPVRRFPLALVLTLLAGCSPGGSGDDPVVAPPTASAVAAPSNEADPSPSEDVPGTVACGALASAINDATLMQPGVVAAVVAASGTADAPIADAAERLARSYATATAAAGTDAEPDAVAKVSADAAEMSDICGESGLDTVG